MATDAISGFGLGVGFVSAVIGLRIVYHFAIRMITMGLEDAGT